MVDDTAFSIFMDQSNIENLVTCTGKTEAPKKQLPHGADKNKVQPRKEMPSKCKVHMSKLHGNDSSCNSYETSNSNFIADENLAKICLLFALYKHCALAL